MRLGVRGRLFLVSFGLVLAVSAALSLFLEHEMKGTMEASVEDGLRREAHAALVAISLSGAPLTPERMDPIADRLGHATSARVTIMAPDGTVVGDSEVDASALRRLENHADRPEVRAAHRRGTGVARRYSTTLATDMLYVALPLGPDRSGGTVRLATPLTKVDQAISRLRLVFLVSGLVALVFAALMSALASHLFVRTLRSLVAYARRMAEGGAREVVAPSSKDEIGVLAGSLNRLAEDLEAQVRALATERDRFEAVLEGMSEAVLALDEAGRITLVNRAALELLGLEGPPLGRTLLEVVRAPELHELVASSRAGRVGSAEIDLFGLPPRRILARSARQKASGGTVVVMHDVTELRRLETMRRDFVANVSHELRTPVAVIRANAETLLDGALGDPEAARGFLESLHRNAERLTRLIADLLDISRIEAGQYPLKPDAVALADATRRALEAMERAAADKRIALESEVPGDLAVVADARALEQVLANLLDNAIKYTQEDGHVNVRARAVDGRVRVEVVDDGPGVEPKHRERLFERFYRADPGRSREMGGTGLGLAIVKHLVLAMGGEVGMESVEPRGSCFWFVLPGKSAV
ncbi:MAG: ATP-binding protein [Deltaproteobacteria bacterium]|nr:ATP-binding protein [Deltaproteobacteria bacterium]